MSLHEVHLHYIISNKKISCLIDTEHNIDIEVFEKNLYNLHIGLTSKFCFQGFWLMADASLLKEC